MYAGLEIYLANDCGLNSGKEMILQLIFSELFLLYVLVFNNSK